MSHAMADVVITSAAGREQMAQALRRFGGPPTERVDSSRSRLMAEAAE